MSGSVCRCNRYIVRSFRVHRATSWHRSTASGRRDVLERGNWRIVAEFTEIESGKRSDRPALDKALAAARVRQVPLECMVGQEGRAVRRATATAISSMGSGRCAGPCEHKFGRSARCSERRSPEQSRARRLNVPNAASGAVCPARCCHRTGRADFPHPALGQDFTPLLSRATPSAVSEHSRS